MKKESEAARMIMESNDSGELYSGTECPAAGQELEGHPDEVE